MTTGEAPRVVGLLGAAIGVAAAGALASLVVRTRGTLPFLLIAPIWLVLYPISPLIGYDLATLGAGEDDDLQLRLGGYSVAVAAAHVAMALVVAGLAIAEVDGDASLWVVLYALCVCPAIPARIAAMRMARRLHVPAGALLGASIVLAFLGWLASVLVLALAASVSGIET